MSSQTISTDLFFIRFLVLNKNADFVNLLSDIGRFFIRFLFGPFLYHCGKNSFLMDWFNHYAVSVRDIL